MRRVLAVAVVATLCAGAARAQSNTSLTKNDHTEIHELLARYAQALDSNNKDMMTSVFTEDAVFTLNGAQAWNGRDKILSLLAGPRLERPKLKHVSSNVLVEPTAEGASASHYVIMIDLQKSPAVIGGAYCDHRVVRTTKGWRLKARNCYMEPGPPSSGEERSAR